MLFNEVAPNKQELKETPVVCSSLLFNFYVSKRYGKYSVKCKPDPRMKHPAYHKKCGLKHSLKLKIALKCIKSYHFTTK